MTMINNIAKVGIGDSDAIEKLKELKKSERWQRKTQKLLFFMH